MKEIKILIFAASITLCGCESMPEKIENEEAREYTSVEKLIAEKIGLDYEDVYGVHTYGNLIRPYSYAKDYCEAYKGNLVRVERYRHLDLPTKNHNPQANVDIEKAFGLYYCFAGVEPLWGIEISNTGANTQTGTRSVYQTNVHVQAYDKQEAKALIKQRELEQKEKIAKENEEKLKREMKYKIAQEKVMSESRIMIANRGIRICKLSENGSYIYIGYTEDSTSEKIKVSIAESVIRIRPEYRAPNFQPVTIWDYPANWYICE